MIRFLVAFGIHARSHGQLLAAGTESRLRVTSRISPARQRLFISRDTQIREEPCQKRTRATFSQLTDRSG